MDNPETACLAPPDRRYLALLFETLWQTSQQDDKHQVGFKFLSSNPIEKMRALFVHAELILFRILKL